MARVNVENTDRASAAWTDAVCAVAFAEEKAGGIVPGWGKIKRNVKRLLLWRLQSFLNPIEGLGRRLSDTAICEVAVKGRAGSPAFCPSNIAIRCVNLPLAAGLLKRPGVCLRTRA